MLDEAVGSRRNPIKSDEMGLRSLSLSYFDRYPTDLRLDGLDGGGRFFTESDGVRHNVLPPSSFDIDSIEGKKKATKIRMGSSPEFAGVCQS